jgi:hypothetical protein
MVQVNGFQQPGLRFVSPYGGLKGFQRQGMDQRKKNTIASGITLFDPKTAGPDIVLSNGFLTATGGAAIPGYESVHGSLGQSGGRVYFEVTCNQGNGGSGTDTVVSIVNALSGPSQGFGFDANSIAFGEGGNYILNSVVHGGVVEAWTTGATVGVAVIADAGLAFVIKIGGAFGYNKGAGDPVAGTGGFSFPFSGPLFPAVALGITGQQHTLNAGATAFQGTPPAGYTAWNGAK